MPKISLHSYDIAVVAVRQDHTSGISVLKVTDHDSTHHKKTPEVVDRIKCFCHEN